MKNERNKKMLAYLLCVVLAVTSLAGSGVAQGSTAYAQGEGDGKRNTDNTTGSEDPGDSSMASGFEEENVATGASFTIDFKKLEPEPETEIPNASDLKNRIFLKTSPELTFVTIQKPKSPESKPTTMFETKKVSIQDKDVTVQWLGSPSIIDGEDNTEIQERQFKYGKEYSVKVSYTIPDGLDGYRMPGNSDLLTDGHKEFHLFVNNACYSLKWEAKDEVGGYKADETPTTDIGKEKLSTVEILNRGLNGVNVELHDRILSITKTFLMKKYTDVNIALETDDSKIKVTYLDENGKTEYADKITFDADDRKQNQVKIILKPNKLGRFDDKAEKDAGGAQNGKKIRVTVKDTDGTSEVVAKNNIEIKDGLLVIHQRGEIVTAPSDGDLRTAIAGKESPVKFKTFRNHVGKENNSKNKDSDQVKNVNDQSPEGGTGNAVSDGNQTENCVKECIYNYKVCFRWQNNTTSLEEMNGKTIKPGINSWACEVRDNKHKPVYPVSGSIVGFNDVSEEIELKKSCNKKTIANDLFGSKSITISGMELKEKKDKKYITVESDKILARKLTKNDITVRVTKIKSGKEIISLEKQPIEVKVKVTPPAGEIWFKTKNKGRRINCYFSPKINELAEKENMKRYGIKSIKVKIKYSKSKSNKQKYFKTAPAAVKRYFQPTVPKKERYVTSRKKFTVKRFQAEIFYMTASGKVQGVLKVTGKYGDKRK